MQKQKNILVNDLKQLESRLQVNTILPLEEKIKAIQNEFYPF